MIDTAWPSEPEGRTTVMDNTQQDVTERLVMQISQLYAESALTNSRKRAQMAAHEREVRAEIPARHLGAND
jgi:ubiquitin C-terminal hydrolase